MRVLFLESHPMWIHGLPNGFRDLGHEVIVSGPINQQKLDKMLSNGKPDLIITMGWGPENSSLQKQKLIRNMVMKVKVPHVYWATEDPTHTKSFTLPFLKTVQPEFVFTICPANVEYYRNLGIRSAHMDFGFHSSVHYTGKPDEKYKNQIAVVANAYPRILKLYPNHYRIQSLNKLIVPLLHQDMRVDFYGRYWIDMKPFLNYDIPEEWIHGYLHYTDARKVYSSADVVIGLQNHPTQLTQRTYEILGSGGFLLTDDTPIIHQVFKPGCDLIVSSSGEETIELVRHYLAHPEQRISIQKKGKLTVSNYSYQQRAEYLLEVLNEQEIFDGKVSRYDLKKIDDILCGQNYHKYTVCNGDTLWKISNKFGISIDQIKILNGLDSDMIYAGQLLALRKNPSDSKYTSAIHISKAKVEKDFIALTYDTGKGAEGVSLLLEVLRKHNVTVTFFLTGEWTERFSDLARKIINDGHEIGNHSHTHPDMTKLEYNEIVREIEIAGKTIKEVTGGECRPLFRPPYGAWDRKVLKAAGEQGYAYSVCWSIDTIDWQQPPVDLIVRRIMEKSQIGDIVLMHSEYLATVFASEQVIPLLKERGLKIVPVGQML